MWKSLHAHTKFSIIAFVLCGGLGLLSMGALGYGLYYLVMPVLGNSIEELSGDTLWPSTILAGMSWSLGFIWASISLFYLRKTKLPTFIHYLVYGFVLWLWILVIWWCLIEFQVVQ